MKTTNVNGTRAQSGLVTNEDRGAEVQRRRLALGIDSLRAFAEATGRDRGTLKQAEEGTSSTATLDWLEAWLSRQEEENGLDDPGGAHTPIRVTFHDVTTSSIGEIIVEGPSDHPDDLIATISRLLMEVRRGTEE